MSLQFSGNAELRSIFSIFAENLRAKNRGLVHIRRSRTLFVASVDCYLDSMVICVGHDDCIFFADTESVRRPELGGCVTQLTEFKMYFQRRHSLRVRTRVGGMESVVMVQSVAHAIVPHSVAIHT